MKKLIAFVFVIAGLLYVFSIIYAGVLYLEKPEIIADLKNPTGPGIPKTKEMAGLLVTAIIVIGGILSTNLGAVLGITLSPPKSPVRPGAAITPPPPLPPKFLGMRPSFHPSDPQKNIVNATDGPQKIQIIASWVYIGSLLVAMIFWLIGTTKEPPVENIKSVIPELATTLIGVIGGVLSVRLGRN